MKTGIYKHYKGNRYEVIGIAHHSETLEPMVVYKALYESKEFGKDAIWVRPQSMFEEMIHINGKDHKRFEYMGDVNQTNQ
jgi:hypothetical protein